MAKDLPYFKFNISEWNDGNITLCSMDAQGLFINLCSIYWSQNCMLSLASAKRRFSDCNASAWKELISDKIIKVSGDKVSIKFLDAQLNERKKTSEVNSKNAVDGWKKRGSNASVKRPHSDGINSAYNIEEKRREENIYNDFGINKTSFFIKAVYAGKKPDRIFELRKYFESTGQLESFVQKGWVHFDEFQNENVGKVFNDPDHLYNTFRNFCSDFKPPENGKRFHWAEQDKELWTLEAWEEGYKYQLKNDNEFRKHFGYAEL